MREAFCNARVYITTLLMLQVCTGIALIAVSGYYHRTLNSYMADGERHLLVAQFSNMYIFGFQLTGAYLCGLAMWKRIWPRRCTQNVKLLLSVWMLFCFLVIICGFSSVWSIFTCAGSLELAAEASLIRGIDLYYSCPEWKLLWDGLQYHKECCGAHDYKDWMKASWMPSGSEKCQAQKKDTVIAPYACCKRNCAACFSNYLPRKGQSVIPSLSLNQINAEGCLPLFVESLWRSIYILVALVLLAFKLNVIISCLVNYLIKYQGCDSFGGTNANYTDDEGRPLVVVKCPPMVRCVTLEDEEDTSMDQGFGAVGSSPSCNCCGETHSAPDCKSQPQPDKKQKCNCCPSKHAGVARTIH